MAGHKLTDEALDEALRLVAEHGNVALAARNTGMSYTTLENRYKRALARDAIDPAIRDSMVAVGTNMVPQLAWAKTKSDDGTSFSVLLKPAQQEPADVADTIRAAFENITPAPIAKAPEAVMADLCSVYPLMDAHVGMQAWGRETGDQDYDLSLAASDMRHAFAKVLAITPASAQAVLIVGGDYFHSDDTTAETFASRHKVDMDGRFLKVVETGINILENVIISLLQKHENLTVRVLRGNHDPHSHLHLYFGIAGRMRDNPRITVDFPARDLFMMQWGKCAIFAHHGDKGKPQQMALYLSDVCEFWSATRHRHYLTGHVHHDQAKDVGPLRWESLRAFCPPDAYAAGMGYGGRRALQSMTFDKMDGLILRALDPIDRPPLEFKRTA